MTEKKKAGPWHRGSRFYSIGREAMRLSALFVLLAGWLRPEYVQAAIGAFSLVAGLLLGGSTWTNLKERDIARAEIQNRNGGNET